MQELKKIIDGYQQFHEQYFQEQPEIYNNLFEQGQSPKFLIISCCDSRVNPSQILGAAPGDIFVIRNVANLVPANELDNKSPAVCAAMEFAVKHLAVKHIIVLGHSQCGGIKSLMEGEHADPNFEFIDPWMKMALSARQQVLDQYGEEDFSTQCSLCEKVSIEISLNNLKTFPWITKRCDAGELFVHGWHFDINTGALLAKQGKQFIPVGEMSIDN